ncbi:MAG: hypothetical protein IKZ90_09435 [Clostridiales bacterium]|nr:hypothetical protein [Clostridiales bacterium]
MENTNSTKLRFTSESVICALICLVSIVFYQQIYRYYSRDLAFIISWFIGLIFGTILIAIACYFSIRNLSKKRNNTSLYVTVLLCFISIVFICISSTRISTKYDNLQNSQDMYSDYKENYKPDPVPQNSTPTNTYTLIDITYDVPQTWKKNGEYFYYGKETSSKHNKFLMIKGMEPMDGVIYTEDDVDYLLDYISSGFVDEGCTNLNSKTLPHSKKGNLLSGDCEIHFEINQTKYACFLRVLINQKTQSIYAFSFGIEESAVDSAEYDTFVFEYKSILETIRETNETTTDNSSKSTTKQRSQEDNRKKTSQDEKIERHRQAINDVTAAIDAEL